MKRLDDDKVSFVEFMRSIRFGHRKQTNRSTECETHFAHLEPQARPEQQTHSAEERKLVRSAN